MDEILSVIVKTIVRAVDPNSIVLFGSRSTGQARPDSDYDLLVLKSGIFNRRELAHQIYRLLVDIPAAVDVLVDTPERAELYRDTPGFVYRDAARGTVLYAR